MNVKKATDYTAMFTALDALMAAGCSQIKLYCEIGRLVSSRPEKGAAVAAAEYLSAVYPDTPVSLPGICAGCGIFTVPMKALRK